jgi:cytochrome oxidase Cu insertion factor (SCO1/SenC/PrrC family)
VVRRGLVAAGLATALLLGGPPPARPHGPPAERTAGPYATSPSLGLIRPAPDFELADSGGRRVRLADLRGRAVLLAFIYTACPAACPLITQRMATLQRRLQAAGWLATRVVLLSVSVDPERDTPAALARYARSFGADTRGWRFLREDPARLAPVLAAWDEWTRVLPGGEIDHPARLHLIDARGRVREIYSLALFDERQAFLDIQALLRETRD